MSAVGVATATHSLPRSVDREMSPKPYAPPSSAAAQPPASSSSSSNSSTNINHHHNASGGSGNGNGNTANGRTPPTPKRHHSANRSTNNDSSPRGSDGKGSPQTSRTAPKIVVKKEPPTSPDLPTSRHRPRRLDLSKNSTHQQLSARAAGGPMTARESGSGIAMQDVGLACLSPGFSTQDPERREQLQRSISVRDQQRSIIESRLQKTAKPGEATSGGDGKGGGSAVDGLKTPSTSKRKAPPGLSIVPPSHEQFANEKRVVQSAPLHQTFTGRHQAHPMTRHLANQPSSNLSTTSHIHHVPAQQTANQLPSINDVFPQERLGAPSNGTPSARGTGGAPPGYYASNNGATTPNARPLPSPGHPPVAPAPPPGSAGSKAREFRSSDEAIATLSGGREELLPKLIHFTAPGGGQTTPGHHAHSHPHSHAPGHRTPPSPAPGKQQRASSHEMRQLHAQQAAVAAAAGAGAAPPPTSTGGGRRRARAEYERDMGSPPLGSGPGPAERREAWRDPPHTAGREREGEVDREERKREEFLSLCARAWDLLHS